MLHIYSPQRTPFETHLLQVSQQWQDSSDSSWVVKFSGPRVCTEKPQPMYREGSTYVSTVRTLNSTKCSSKDINQKIARIQARKWETKICGIVTWKIMVIKKKSFRNLPTAPSLSLYGFSPGCGRSVCCRVNMGENKKWISLQSTCKLEMK